MDDTLETFVPLTFRCRGARRVAADERHVHDVTLLEGVARGFYWQHLVDTGVMKSGSDIARAEGLHAVLEKVMRRPWPKEWAAQKHVLPLLSQVELPHSTKAEI